MIQGGATTQPAPVGVGWGNYPVAWLLTYNGADCALWRYVYSKCMESELCRRLIDLLPTIGYRLEMHKCYADLDDLNDIACGFETPQPSNNTSKSTNTTPNNHTKIMQKVLEASTYTQKQHRLDAYAPLLKTPSSRSSPSSTPLLLIPGY